jgi:hypothetical protein
MQNNNAELRQAVGAVSLAFLVKTSTATPISPKDYANLLTEYPALLV